MRHLGIAIGFVALLALSAGAMAQETCSVDLSVDDDPSEGSFEPGEQRVATFTISNDGDLDAEGEFVIISTRPDGWFWSPETRNVEVASGSETDVDVTVRWEGEREIDAVLEAEVQDVVCPVAPLGQTSADGADSSTVSLAFTHSPLPDDGGEDDPPWMWIVFGTIVAGAVVGVPIVQRARGVRMSVSCEESERAVRPGRGTSYPVRLENEGSAAVAVDLDVTDVQEGWSALTTLPTLELGPDETRTVYMMVRAPEDAKPGDLCVAKLGVTPEGGRTEEVKTLTRVDDDAPAEDRASPSDEE